MRIFFLTVLFLFSSTAVSAHDDSVVVLSEPSDRDVATAKAKTDAVVELLVSGQVDRAIEAATSDSQLLKQKVAEVGLLADQTKAAFRAYGTIEQCEFWQRLNKSRFLLELTYICQHQSFILKWDFVVARLPKGWVITNLQFTDDF